MPKLYKEARLMNKIKLTDMADKLGISQPTLSSWESEATFIMQAASNFQFVQFDKQEF